MHNLSADILGVKKKKREQNMLAQFSSFYLVVTGLVFLAIFKRKFEKK